MSTTATATTPHIQPPSVLLLGAPGSGKTYSISTLLEFGLKTFVIITEPTGLDSLLNACAERKLPLDNLHWVVHTPARGNFAGLLNIAKLTSTGTFETLAKLPPQGERHKAQFMQILSSCQNFVCQRDGKTYGDITNLGPDCAVVVDSLSGLNTMAMDLVIGDKPSAHQGEWGVAMNVVEKLLLNLTSALRATFVLTAHIEREVDEITGAQRVMASALGRKLAPKIPRFFSEVVLAKRVGESFVWSTSDLQTDLKRRSLPLGEKLAPSFAPVVQAYLNRLQQIGAPAPKLSQLTVSHA